MSDDNGFVERPVMRGPTRMSQIMATAENGKALLIKANHSSYGSGYGPYLKEQGLRLRRSTKGAPEGHLYIWAEKMAPVTGAAS